MSKMDPADTLHRLLKHALDSGAAETIAEAQAMFLGYRVALSIDAASALDPAQQATMLTSVALARRVFLGGVTVEGALDTPVARFWRKGGTLADAAISLGAALGPRVQGTPLISIGGSATAQQSEFHVRTVSAGWRGGVAPASAVTAAAAGPAMPLSGMLAAGLAINEAYLHVSGDMPAAGHRLLGLSLWRPDEKDWLRGDGSEPHLERLPSALWLIGLGHLGQAYLWGLGLLPYTMDGALSLVLQDVDKITPSTESTSILTDESMLNTRKTRAMAAWAESQGFTASIVERRFDEHFQRRPEEPPVALCGVDNALGRQALDQVGFDLVVEAGLGHGYRDFRTLRLHTLPSARRASDIWKSDVGGEALEERSAYQRMIKEGADRCGVTLLAGKAVGAPFVGTVAASLALAEILRLLHGGHVHQLLDLDLQSVDHRTVIENVSISTALNPGWVGVAR